MVAWLGRTFALRTLGARLRTGMGVGRFIAFMGSRLGGFPVRDAAAAGVIPVRLVALRGSRLVALRGSRLVALRGSGAS